MWRQALGRLLWGLAAHSLALLPGWMEGGGPTAPTRWPVWRWPPGARPTLLGSGFHGSAHTWTPSGGGLRGVHAGNSGCGDPRAPRLEVASGGCAPKGSLATHAPCLEAASGGASAIIIVLNFMPELVAGAGAGGGLRGMRTTAILRALSGGGLRGARRQHRCGKDPRLEVASGGSGLHTSSSRPLCRFAAASGSPPPPPPPPSLPSLPPRLSPSPSSPPPSLPPPSSSLALPFPPAGVRAVRRWRDSAPRAVWGLGQAPLLLSPTLGWPLGWPGAVWAV